MSYPNLGADSIRLMAEAAWIPEPSLEVANAISEDATFRLQTIISRAVKFMRHSNRTRLTCADINKALRWSDCQPVFGFETNGSQRLRYSYSTEARVFRYEDNKVDLAQRYKDKSSAKRLFTDCMVDEAVPNVTIEELG